VLRGALDVGIIAMFLGPTLVALSFQPFEAVGGVRGNQII
jgi:hypothetical protein